MYMYVHVPTVILPPTARCVVISFGITGSVIMFPIGLVLLFVAYCCCHGKESDDWLHKHFSDCKCINTVSVMIVISFLRTPFWCSHIHVHEFH